MMASDLNGSLSTATVAGAVSTTAISLSGTIDADTDVDIYRFTVSANQVVDFDIDTTQNGPGGLGSYLRLFDSFGNQLAFNNDGNAPGEDVVGYDAYIRYTFSTAGTFYIGVSNLGNTSYNPVTGGNLNTGSSNATGDYQLNIQAQIADLDNTFAAATSLGAITTVAKGANSAINPDYDVDMYSFTVTGGQVVDIDIDTPLNGPGGLGSFLRLFNSSGQMISSNDDGTAPGENVLGYDAYIRYTFGSAGTYYVGVSNLNNITYNPVLGTGYSSGGFYSIGTYQINIQTMPPDLDNTLSSATVLGAISTTAKVSSSAIDPDTDIDLYRFTVTAGQIVDFDIDTPQNGPGGLGSYIRLFNSAGTEIASNNDGLAPGDLTAGFDSYLRYTFNVGGTYYLGVTNYNNISYNPVDGSGINSGGSFTTGSYQLSILSLPSDLDNTFATATILGAVSTTVSSTNSAINPDYDVDLYRFTVTAGQIVDFDIDTTLNGPGGLGSYIRLFNSSGTELAANDDGVGPGETRLGYDSYMRYTFTSGGTYYLGVSNLNNNTYNPLNATGLQAGGFDSIGSYQLNINSLLPDLDNTLASSTNLGAISTVAASASAAVNPDYDVDLYRFTVTAGQIVDFNVNTTENGPGGLGGFLRLFNSAGQEIAYNDDGAAPGENTLGFDPYLRYTFASSGTYYVGISNNNNVNYNPVNGLGVTAGGLYSVGSYQLIVQTRPPDLDNTFATATALGAVLTSPKSTSSTIDPDTDIDLYSFTVSAGQIVDFNVNTTLNGPGGLGSYLRVFNSAGVQLASNNNAAAPGEPTVGFDAYLRYTFATAGTYYVGVTNFTNISYDPTTGNGIIAGGTDATGNYTLIVQTLLPDNDNTLTKATAVGAVSTTTKVYFASIDPDIDIDLYQFTATAGQVVDFDIDTTLNGPGGLGSYLRLFNSVGQQLASNNDAAAPGESSVGYDAYLRYTIPVTGTYYIGVTNYLNINYDPVTGTGILTGATDGTGSYQLSIQIPPANGPLTLSFDTGSISESGGVATATVSRGTANITQAVTVTLLSNDTSEATVATTVTIPANQTSTTFAVSAVTDNIPDGNQAVGITVSATGYTSATQFLTVLDVDPIYHNTTIPEDVDGDGFISPADALWIINYLNATIAAPAGAQPPPYLDTSGDGLLSSIDVLIVINYLNSHPLSGEGELSSASVDQVMSEAANPASDSAVTASSNDSAATATDASELDAIIANLALDTVNARWKLLAAG